MPGARHLLLLALFVGLALAAPPAAAQEVATEVTVSIAPLGGPVMPLLAARTTEIRVDVPCAAAGTAPAGGEAHLWVIEAPAWLTIGLDPVSYPLNAATCQNGRITNTVVMTLMGHELGPAFTPTSVSIGVAREGGATNITGSGSVTIELDFVAILDAQLEEAIKVASPDTRTKFPLKVENRGNGRMLVTFELADVTEGFEAVVPEPIVLDSVLQGGSKTSTTVDIIVTTPSKFGYNNEVGAVSVRMLAKDADGRGNETDASVVSVLVTSKGVSATPGLGPLAVLGVVLAALVARRARA